MASNATISDPSLSTPRNIRLGMTQPEDVAFPLRWGITGTGSISTLCVLSLRGCTVAS